MTSAEIVQHGSSGIAAAVLPPWPERGMLAYTIGTLVTDVALYGKMRQSFIGGGFTEADCEYVAIDNTGPSQTSAYLGLNRILDEARGRHVILCHQDVLLIDEGRAELDQRLAELEEHDPTWGVAGNAGGVAPGQLSLRLTDPHGGNWRLGQFPQRVMSLDENFMIVKRGARIGFSRDLVGFHLYGADICLIASVLGYQTYVIDFHLEHLSAGDAASRAFALSMDAFQRKWSRALRPRWVQTTCTLIGLSGNRIGGTVRHAIAPRVAKIAQQLTSVRGQNEQDKRK